MNISLKKIHKKRNHNMLVIVYEEFEIYPNFRWITLGRINKLSSLI